MSAISPEESDSINVAAHRLAIHFTEDTDLPARFRRVKTSTNATRKAKEDSEIEKRFSINVKLWASLVRTMLSKIESNQAWRFINLSPEFKGDIRRVSDNNDFCEFIDYLALRRDREHCESDELGNLAILSVAFQREIEKRIPT